MSFQVLTQLGGCTNFNRNEIKGSGGQLRSIYPILSSWGAEKDKTPNYDSVSRWLSVQHARMGFNICVLRYLFAILIRDHEAHLMIRLFLSSLPYTASRKACQRCCKQSLNITLEITH